MKTLLQLSFQTKMLALATAILASLVSIGAAIQHSEARQELAQRQAMEQAQKFRDEDQKRRDDAQKRSDANWKALASGVDVIRFSHTYPKFANPNPKK